jgi:hypothetical protein
MDEISMSSDADGFLSKLTAMEVRGKRAQRLSGLAYILRTPRLKRLDMHDNIRSCLQNTDRFSNRLVKFLVFYLHIGKAEMA